MACEGCTCGRSQRPQAPGRAEESTPAPTESFEQLRRNVRSFTSSEDTFQQTEGVEPAIPLRSKKWFNDPDDPGASSYLTFFTVPFIYGMGLAQALRY